MTSPYWVLFSGYLRVWNAMNAAYNSECHMTTLKLNSMILLLYFKIFLPNTDFMPNTHYTENQLWPIVNHVLIHRKYLMFLETFFNITVRYEYASLICIFNIHDILSSTWHVLGNKSMQAQWIKYFVHIMMFTVWNSIIHLHNDNVNTMKWIQKFTMKLLLISQTLTL